MAEVVVEVKVPRLTRALLAAASAALSPVTWLLLLVIGGFALTTIGVGVTLGAGPAMILLGVEFFIVAGLIVKGMTRE